MCDREYCTLMCDFGVNLSHKSSQEKMSYWLQHKSGLSGDYFEKIVRLEYDGHLNKSGADGLKITLDETANCFIAMKQIRNRIFYGPHGICKVSVNCPRGVFRSIHLSPETVELLTEDGIIMALKYYGEIIEMLRAKWCDSVNDNYMPTGDIFVKILLKRKLPANNKLNIGGIICKIKEHTYEINHSDVRIYELWENCKPGNEFDYTKEVFLQNITSGCRITIKCITGVDYIASPKEVYDWLVRKSGLSKDYLRRILVFKSISAERHEIIFDHGVNCLSAINEMKNNKINYCHGIGMEVDITCPKGQFKDVILKSDGAGGKLLTRQSVEKVVESYDSVIMKYHKVPTATLKSKTDCNISFEVHCNLFLKSEDPKLPKEIQINGNNVEVIIFEAEPEHYDEMVLNRLWNGLDT